MYFLFHILAISSFFQLQKHISWAYEGLAKTRRRKLWTISHNGIRSDINQTKCHHIKDAKSVYNLTNFAGCVFFLLFLFYFQTNKKLLFPFIFGVKPFIFEFLRNYSFLLLNLLFPFILTKKHIITTW